jgi:crotonobetainyl-CoA:carnitine CoA-transferase CaiB-like acyl-CoA transferase
MVERGIHLAYRKSACWRLSAYGRARRISTRQFNLCGCPVKMSKSIPEYTAVPPLGQHNKQVYAEWMGYSKEEVARLKEEGVI